MQAAEAAGRRDEEMPAGTADHVLGKGNGVIRGFKKNRMGANAHLIEFVVVSGAACPTLPRSRGGSSR